MVVDVSGDGHRVCDERCYNAKRLGCSCVCGGKNHGLGLRRALEGQGFTEAEIDEVVKIEELDRELEDGLARKLADL